MPLVTIETIRGVLAADQKRALIEKVTEAVLEVEGESMRSVTWVRIMEYPEGEWGIGGRPVTAADVRALKG